MADDIAVLLGLAPPSASRSAAAAASRSSVSSQKQMHAIEDVYEIGDTLGRGAFSVVKLGRHKVTGNEFAIKVINKKSGKMSSEALEKEIKIFKKVDHPHCVKFQELFETADKMYIVSELITGGEMLDRIVGQGSYSEAQAARIVKQITEALMYLHSCGIVHRDLKPENILLANKEPSAPVKISDFGLSALRGETGGGASELMKTACGTLHYASPQVLLRTGYDHRCDFWSLGVVLYIMLSGNFPFDGEQMVLAKSIVAAKFKFHEKYWGHISEPAKDLVRHLLTVEPDERYGGEDILAHPWIQGNASTAFFPDDVITSIRRFTLRRRFKRVAMAVLATTILTRALRFSPNNSRNSSPANSRPSSPRK